MGKGSNSLEGGISPEEGVIVYAAEPLTSDRINGIITEIFTEFDRIKNPEQLESFLREKLGEIQTLQSQIQQLSGEEDEMLRQNNMLTSELERLNIAIKEKERQLSKMFLDKIGEKMKRNVLGILTAFGIAGAGAGVGNGVVNWLVTSPEEQILINEQNQKARTALEATFNRLGITIDEDYSLAGVVFKRRTQDVAFSERVFLNENDFYQLEGDYQGYKSFIAFPFSAPENVIVGVGEVKTELEKPTKENIEAYIHTEYARQESERIQKEQAEAKKKADDELKKKQDTEAKAQKKVEIEAENSKVINARKQGVISVIETLTGTQNYILGEPIIFEAKRGKEKFQVALYPERLLGELSKDENWLGNENNRVIIFTSRIPNSELKVGERYMTSFTMKISVLEPHNFETIIDWNRQDRHYNVIFKPNSKDLEVFWRDIQIELFGLVDPLTPNIADKIRGNIGGEQE